MIWIAKSVGRLGDSGCSLLVALVIMGYNDRIGDQCFVGQEISTSIGYGGRFLNL